ncbi:MAG: PTS fructose transporter subunit IIA [Gammaproteobacteria bacterium RIFCSPLOWO2_02_FULL_47_50]|jgi:PTS system ascorbate-specific IIA component|nr:MAG: PTS fructose transporter subunit IIA [Gammaproteobacteria bacterium RIFCSPLOWO2_02_47_7]OGT66281.1 MAG: PTS fructose transporter subunit IIA [Gammaproteobacteria bacterium RIFCSPLOWO2_01_FULL_47_190]OGT75515.1 MAG: PTS fructose transporter subunit IIA [Gammaproteobacteria bacterium RIFCSPLOWO2_12_47_11]OGT79111.1 MAG: PTS fructose transporter subunit IIA [Gammaproteobacteria bacterium RIFCSPLOWO2_02_FULL_47_50]OGT83970.1 MAG: PTS fructose transporter subunit IIA [Gammaproteobacteria bac
MSVGLLIISHDGIGPAILGTATFMFDGCSLQTRLLAASRDCDPDELIADASEQIAALDEGDGVLILTDLYGSTPSNVAKKLSSKSRVRTVTGMNLSMLMRVFNYPQLDLEQLAEKAVSGGRNGIVLIEND